MSRLRNLGRWLTDWRTGATVVASILVALLAVIVIDAIQSRRASEARADRTIRELEITVEELQRRGVRIDDLAAQLDDAAASRDRLAEEVRALRELLIDMDAIEPRPAASPTPRRPASPSATTQPRPKPSGKPKPSAKPAPSGITGTCLVPPDREDLP